MDDFFTKYVKGLGNKYSGWQQYAGFSEENPFGASPEATTPIAPTPIDATMEKPNYGIAPVAPVTGLGMKPNYGFGLPQATAPNAPMTLRDAIKQHFDEE